MFQYFYYTYVAYKLYEITGYIDDVIYVGKKCNMFYNFLFPIKNKRYKTVKYEPEQKRNKAEKDERIIYIDDEDGFNIINKCDYNIDFKEL